MKQSSHTNQCCTLHKFFIYAIWIIDLLRYIPPELLLCDLTHEPPISNCDGDIISNLKSASTFEYLLQMVKLKAHSNQLLSHKLFRTASYYNLHYKNSLNP
jgi:hypothetical protein